MRSHPSHVEKIRSGASSQRQHCPSRNPPAFDDRERNVSITEQSENSLGNPSAMTKFDGESKIPRQLANEINECGQLIWLEVGAELHENWTELGTQLANGVEELAGRSGNIAQPLLVSHFLRHLEREDKSGWRSRSPSLERRRSGDSVECRIDLHGFERARI